jgi:hypothetical protein
MTQDEMWTALKAQWHPNDPDTPDEDMERYYKCKFSLALSLQPKVIGEIGVRAGYSAFAFLSAAPEAEYVGYDADQGQWGGQRGFTAHAEKLLAPFRHTITYMDSQETVRYSRPFDLFHVDGDHSYAGCLHDLEVAWPVSRWVLVDDYDFILPVRAAVNEFIVKMRIPFPGYQSIPDQFRGNMLLMGGLHPNFASRVA